MAKTICTDLRHRFLGSLLSGKFSPVTFVFEDSNESLFFTEANNRQLNLVY